jgi:predicted NBD/HSP70 family sugar kinase
MTRLSEALAAIDLGGTFTKLALVEDDQVRASVRFPSALVWSRRDLVAPRLLSELRRLAHAAGYEAPERLADFEAVLLSYAGKPRADGRLGLAYVREWAAAARVEEAAAPTAFHAAELFGVAPDRVLAMVDKEASAFAFMMRNPRRDGAALTLGTGSG